MRACVRVFVRACVCGQVRVCAGVRAFVRACVRAGVRTRFNLYRYIEWLQDFLDDSVSPYIDFDRDYRSSFDVDVVNLPEIYNHVMSVHRCKSTTPRRTPRRRKRVLAMPRLAPNELLPIPGQRAQVTPSKSRESTPRAPPAARVPAPPSPNKRNNPFGFYRHEMPRLTPTFTRSPSSLSLSVPNNKVQRSRPTPEPQKQRKLPVIFQLTSPPPKMALNRRKSTKSRFLS